MQKLLFTASTYSHILNFHLPYLQYFEQQGWTLHLACGGEKASVPHVSELRKNKTGILFPDYYAYCACGIFHTGSALGPA